MEGKLTQVALQSGMVFNELYFTLGYAKDNHDYILAIDKKNPNLVTYIQPRFIEYFEVEHEHTEETVQGETPADDGGSDAPATSGIR